MITNKNYIDVKCTVWERHYFSDDTDMSAIAQRFSIGDTLGIVGNEEEGFEESEMQYMTQKEMSFEDNGNQPTIVVFSNNETIWENGV